MVAWVDFRINQLGQNLVKQYIKSNTINAIKYNGSKNGYYESKAKAKLVNL